MRQNLLITLAAVCCLLAVLAELGAEQILPARTPTQAEIFQTLDAQPKDGPEIDLRALSARKQNPTPPGLAIRYLALYDGLLFVSLAMMGLGGFLSVKFPKADLRIRNISLFLASLVDVILCLILALLAFALLMVMVGLFLAAPFGTIAYLVAFGFFDSGRATMIITLLFVLKVVAVVLLALAGQLSRRLLVRVGVSLVLCVLVSFLHGFPPSFLVSILDALAAIVVAIIALIFALPVLVGGLLGVIKALRA